MGKSGKVLHELSDVGTGKSLVEGQLFQCPPDWFATRERPDSLFQHIPHRFRNHRDTIFNQNIFCYVHGDQYRDNNLLTYCLRNVRRIVLSQTRSNPLQASARTSSAFNRVGADLIWSSGPAQCRPMTSRCRSGYIGSSNISSSCIAMDYPPCTRITGSTTIRDLIELPIRQFLCAAWMVCSV